MQIQSFDINNEVNYEGIRETTVDSLVDSNWPWFCIGRHPASNKIEPYDIGYIQDTVKVHVGTKLRTRFLKPNIILPIGDYNASINHILTLTKEFSKDKHLLTISDLKAKDKMNYKSAEKMCSI